MTYNAQQVNNQIKVMLKRGREKRKLEKAPRNIDTAPKDGTWIRGFDEQGVEHNCSWTEGKFSGSWYNHKGDFRQLITWLPAKVVA